MLCILHKLQKTRFLFEEEFRVESINPVIDQLYSVLTDRLLAYEMACERFDFFNHLDELNETQLRSAAENLVENYKEHLDSHK